MRAASSLVIMVKHAKSESLKRQVARKQKDDLMVQAVAMYHKEHVKPPTEKRKSLREICQTVYNNYFAHTQRGIQLSHQTLEQLDFDENDKEDEGSDEEDVDDEVDRMDSDSD